MGSGRFRVLFECIYIEYWRQWQEAFVLGPKLEEKGRAKTTRAWGKQGR